MNYSPQSKFSWRKICGHTLFVMLQAIDPCKEEGTGTIKRAPLTPLFL